MNVLGGRAPSPGHTARVGAPKVKRVVYLIESALTQRNYDRFGIGFFICRGVDVTVFDVGLLTLPEIPGDRSGYGNFRGFSLSTVENRQDLSKTYRTTSEADLVISLVGTGHVTPRNIPVYRAIGRSKTPYLVLSLNAYPGWTGEGDAGTGILERTMRLAKRIAGIKPAKSIAARLPRSWLGVPAARFIVFGGRKSRVRNRFIDETTIPIAGYAMDYEVYRDVAQRSINPANTAVFIDEYRPYHPDLREMGLQYTPAEAAYYFARMRDVFDRIERELGLEVVIAAMPKADYRDKPGVYGDRRIESGRTGELVAESRLVLGHRSTALGYAVMFRKPVLQIATRDIYREKVQKPYFDSFARALGKPIEFCDDPAAVDLSRAFDIDAAKYEAFMRDYIAEGPVSGALWEIVLGAVEGSLCTDGRGADPALIRTSFQR